MLTRSKACNHVETAKRVKKLVTTLTKTKRHRSKHNNKIKSVQSCRNGKTRKETRNSINCTRQNGKKMQRKTRKR